MAENGQGFKGNGLESPIEDMIEEMDTLVTENIKCKINPGTKHTRNLAHYEKAKSTDKNNKGRRKEPDQKHRKYIWQNYRTKFPQTNMGDIYQDARRTQNTKQTGKEIIHGT